MVVRTGYDGEGGGKAQNPIVSHDYIYYMNVFIKYKELNLKTKILILDFF